MIRFFALLLILPNCGLIEFLLLRVTEPSLWNGIRGVKQPGPSPALNHRGGSGSLSQGLFSVTSVLCTESQEPAGAR